MFQAITALGVCIIICAAAVTIGFFQSKSSSRIVRAPSGAAVVNAVRSCVIEYANQIRDMHGTEDFDDDILDVQEATCYQILGALDQIMFEAYSIDLDRMCANVEDGMNVKELMYALSACPLDARICVLTKAGPQKLTMCFKSGDDKTAMLCDDSMVAQ